MEQIIDKESITSVEEINKELMEWKMTKYIDILQKKIIYRIRDGGDFYLIYKGKPYRKSLIELLSDDYKYMDSDNKVHNLLEDMLYWSPDSEAWPICELEIDFSKSYGRIPETEKFNLFQGFKTKPIETGVDTSIIWNHIKEVLAGGNEDYNRYICSWIADLFQHPTNKPGVCLGFNGEQGTGKSIIFDNLIIKQLIGQDYGLHTVVDPFDNKFNGQVGGKLLINIDEGGWSMDKRSAGAMKSFITQDTIEIEQKGKDRYSVRNDARLVFTTNSEWIAQLERTDRRYAIFTTSNIHLKDYEYFNKLSKAINDSLIQQQFLFELLHYEITVDLKVIPETEARSEQKLQSKGYVGQYIDMCREDFTALQIQDLYNPGWILDHDHTYRISLSNLLTLLKSKYGPSLNIHRLSKELKEEGLKIDRSMVDGMRCSWVYFDLGVPSTATSATTTSSFISGIFKNKISENDVVEVVDLVNVVEVVNVAVESVKDPESKTESSVLNQEGNTWGTMSNFSTSTDTIEDTIEYDSNHKPIWASDKKQLSSEEIKEYRL
jgi:hypothetical protein